MEILNSSELRVTPKREEASSEMQNCTKKTLLKEEYLDSLDVPTLVSTYVHYQKTWYLYSFHCSFQGFFYSILV